MDDGREVTGKVIKKGKGNGFEMLDVLAMWEQSFSMLCVVCTKKWSSLNCDLIISGNYVVITIILMFIYVYMYVCMYVVVWQYHDCLMLIFICIYVYVCMLVSDRVVKNHSRGGMIAYAGEWHEEVPGLWGIKWQSSPDKSTRLVSCRYELILCDYTMSILWTCYTKGYISEMKAVCVAERWDKHG